MEYMIAGLSFKEEDLKASIQKQRGKKIRKLKQ
jgi:hypothetical protein